MNDPQCFPSPGTIFIYVDETFLFVVQVLFLYQRHSFFFKFLPFVYFTSARRKNINLILHT